MSDSLEKIGSYTVEREIGRGGMGVVYLAKDSRLDRHVAIKVLPDEVSRDAGRLARFEREARLLASLKHPNIGGIHGLEEAGGQRFLVLEHLEGETLAKRLDGGPLRVSEAIHVCRQIAAALEAAHESGIIHRDLKPGNVMITDDDEAKVLDFGLAKGDEVAADSNSDMSASPTMPAGATAAGVILGTAAYMSPEQARGRSVDRRTDIWSFGCVLYECLTGKQLFSGETVSDTIARILEREPDWDALPKDTPDRVRELLRRCLEKKARERLRDIGDARIELEEVESGKTSSISGVSAGVLAAEHKRRLRVAWSVATVAAIIAIGTSAALLSRPQSGEPPLMRLEVPLPVGLQMFTSTEDAAISPDGTTIVFPATDSAGVTRLYLRELASLDVRPLPGTEDALQPFWSPDSRQIGFFSGAKLRTLTLEDGQVEVLADVNSSRGGSWGAEYIIYAGAQGPIYKVPIQGGPAEAVTEVDTTAGHTAHRFPAFLPDGKRFMYSVLPPLTGNVKVHVSDVSGTRPREIMSAPGRPSFAEPGYLVWQRGGRLVAQRFDSRGLKLAGSTVPIGASPTRSYNAGAPPVSMSRSGTILQLPPSVTKARLEWQDYAGNTLEKLNLEERAYTTMAISPDGKTLAVAISENDFQSDIWLIDLQRLTPTRFTFGPGASYQPYWSPAGDRIFYASDHDGPIELYVKSVARPERDTVLVESDAMFKNPVGWSSDGRYVLYSQPGTGSGLDMWMARVDVEGAEPEPYLAGPFSESFGSLSPDSRWFAYTSDESGTTEIYITSFPEPGRRHRVSTGGGLAPAWSYDGRRLFYGSATGATMSVAVQTEPHLQIGTPRRVIAPKPRVVGGAASPTDARALLAIDTSPERRPSLLIVTGWMREME